MIVARIPGSNWFSREGAARKMAAIRRRGVPDLSRWRLITLTLDPSQFETPAEGYLAGRERMRRFLHGLRDYLGISDVRWAWKLEFQSNGWAHWHLVFEFRQKFDLIDLEVINRLWGLGRTNVRMVRDGSLEYLWKYVGKASFRNGDEDGDCPLPSWWLDYWQPREGRMPETMGRARFWQTSRNFYLRESPAKIPSPPPLVCLVPQTARQVYERHKRRVRIIAETPGLGIAASATVYLKRPWTVVSALLGRFAIVGRAAPARGLHTSVAERDLERLLDPLCLTKLKKLVELNMIPHQTRLRWVWARLGVGLPF